MKQQLLVHAIVGCLVAFSGSILSAQDPTVDLSLNLMFTDDTDDQSGGMWELVARTENSEGLAGLSALVSGIVAADPIIYSAPHATIDGGTPVGFEVLEAFQMTDHVDLSISQFPQDSGVTQPLFYDVGVIGGGTVPGANGTPSFTFDQDSEVSIPWGIGDPLGDSDWDGAVSLAGGQFSPGTIPSFFADIDDSTRAVVFTTVGSDFEFGDRGEADITTIVRDNLAAANIAGDYDDDDFVGQGDIDLVLLNWGADVSGGPPAGWTSNLPSGNVDQDELDQVLLNWGTSAALGGASSVPEPSTLLLLAAAFFSLAVGRKVGWF